MNWLFLEQDGWLAKRAADWAVNAPSVNQQLFEWGVRANLLRGLDLPSLVQLLASPGDYTPLVTALAKVRHNVPPFNWPSDEEGVYVTEAKG